MDGEIEWEKTDRSVPPVSASNCALLGRYRCSAVRVWSDLIGATKQLTPRYLRPPASACRRSSTRRPRTKYSLHDHRKTLWATPRTRQTSELPVLHHRFTSLASPPRPSFACLFSRFNKAKQTQSKQTVGCKRHGTLPPFLPRCVAKKPPSTAATPDSCDPLRPSTFLLHTPAVHWQQPKDVRRPSLCIRLFSSIYSL
jgi:hypothetical protein